VVALSSNNSFLIVPASVIIAAGALTGSFSAMAAGTIASNQSATITATLGSSSARAVISLTIPTGTSGAPPAVWIESPTSGSFVNGTVTISGWAVDSALAIGTPITSVQVKVDGALVGYATYGLSRPDVCNIFPGRPGCPNVGYSYQLNTSTIVAGPHIITVTATDSDSPPQTGSSSTAITVLPPPVPAFIQESTALNSIDNPAIVSFPAASTTGNLIVIQVTQDNQNANVASITDNKGNIYNRAIGGMNWGPTGTEVRSELWYAADIVGDGSPVAATVKLDADAKSFVQLYISEYSGLDGAPLDQVAFSSATGTFSGIFDSGARTTTASNELVFGHCEMWNGTTIAETGFNTQSTTGGNIEESMNVTSVGGYHAACRVNGSGPMVMMATFKADSTGAHALSVSDTPQTLATSRTHSKAENQASDLALGTSDGRQKHLLTALSCSPNAVNAGAPVTCELHLTPDANSSSVRLESSSDMVRIPTSLVTRPNQSVVTFKAHLDSMAENRRVDITASAGSTEVHDTIQVTNTSGPVLTAPKKLTARIGSPVSFTVRASDPADSPLDLIADGVPSGATFDPVRRRFAWIPETSQTGSYNVTFTASEIGRAHV